MQSHIHHLGRRHLEQRAEEVHLPNDIKFLIACCKLQASQEETEFILAFTKQDDLNIQRLLELAGAHGIIPLIYKALKKLSDNGLLDAKDAVLNTFKDSYVQIARRNMLMSAELLRIMKLLEKSGINALAFKGPTLAQLAYGDITLRQFGDLDILVNERDAWEAAKTLIEHNYTSPFPLAMLENPLCLEAAKDFSLFNKSGNVHIELHWRLFEKKYNISIFSMSAGNLLQDVSINGSRLATLSNEVLLVYLCLHGAKHAFERLGWVCDIDRLLRSVPIDWEICTAIAEKSHALRSFYLGLSLAHQILHIELPKEMYKVIDTSSISAMQMMVIQQWVNPKRLKNDMEKNWSTYLYLGKLFDKKSDMFRFYVSILFKISTSDCQSLLLPKRLTFLYPLLRPVRLIWKYVSQLIGRISQ